MTRPEVVHLMLLDCGLVNGDGTPTPEVRLDLGLEVDQGPLLQGYVAVLPSVDVVCPL